MKLFYAPGVCSQASHIALIEAKLPFELERVEFGMPHRTASGQELAEVTPKNAVPALQLDDDDLLTENAVILQYVADQAPSSGLMPPEGSRARYHVLEWLSYVSADIHRNFTALFQPVTPDNYKPVARAAVEKRFDYVESQLKDSGYLTGDSFTVADAYLFVTLGWARRLEFDMTRWPKLQALFGRIAGRASVQQAMKTEGLI